MVEHEPRQRFEALLREHQRIVFKIAGAYARTLHDRDDLAQEIAVQLWRSFPRFDAERAKFSTWMYRVALNVAISHARESRRAGAERFEPLAEAQAEGVADGTALPVEALEQRERVDLLRAFIRRLGALDRALVLLHLEDRSYAEMADVPGISETNVATRLNRIRQTLRRHAANAQTKEVANGTR